MLMMKCTRLFLASKGEIHVQTLRSQKVISNVSLQKEFLKLYSLPHASPKIQQGVGSTVDSKPRLRNYKFHIKKKVRSCSIVNHFIDVCSDTNDPSRNIRFIIIDQLDNTKSFPR